MGGKPTTLLADSGRPKTRLSSDELYTRATNCKPDALLEWARRLFRENRPVVHSGDDGLAEDELELGEQFARGTMFRFSMKSKNRRFHRLAVDWLVRAYEHGSDSIREQAAFKLGELFGEPMSTDTRGGPTLRNVPRSLVWFRRAARLGSEDAKRRLVETYRLGNGVLRNDDKARRWFVELFGPDEPFSGGTPSTVSTLGPFRHVSPWRDLSKESAERDETVAKAVRTIRDAESEESVRQAKIDLVSLCNQGFAPAIAAWVAEIFDTARRNRGCRRVARTFLRDAVRQGHPDSLALAGRWLLTGGFGVRQDIPRARALLARAAAAGSVAALVELGNCARCGLGERKDADKAKRLLEEAGEKGAGRGWFLRARLEGSWSEAVASGLLRKAAELGDIRACHRLGYCYRTGTGVSKDFDEADRWLGKSAMRRYPMAQFEHALVLYASNRYPEAVQWFEKALVGGMPEAGVLIGWFRLRGMKPFGRSSVRSDWLAAERLFRRHCPGSNNPGVRLFAPALSHFWSKPENRRTDRDRRFLEWFKQESLLKDPERGAVMFQEKDPAFARLCAEEAENRKKGEPFEETFHRFAERADGAEVNWDSGDETLSREAGNVYVGLAKEASKRVFTDGFERYLDNKNRPMNAGPDEDRILLARCFGRAAQTSLRENDLPEDAKIRIGKWLLCALEPFPPNRFRTWGTSPPSFVLETATSAWKRAEELKIPPRNAKNACVVAARLGSKDALLRLAEADLFWLNQAVAADIPAALRMKADQILAEKNAGPEETERAEELLRKAADGGDPEAQCRLGEKLSDEAASDDDRRRAVAWFGKAAENGHGRATLLLGRCLLEGFGTERNAERALKWFVQAAKPARTGDPVRAEANFEIGRLLLANGETKQALIRLALASRNGNKDAMAVLALDDRLRGPVKDAEIRNWCRHLLKLPPGDERLRGRVLTRLGRIPDGFGTVEAQRERSADCFRQAAEAGDGPGAYEWARCLLFGDGVPRSRRRAKEWFRKAAERCKGLEGDDGKLPPFADAWLKTSLFD